jgi:hypothetical protein
LAVDPGPAESSLDKAVGITSSPGTNGKNTVGASAAGFSCLLALMEARKLVKNGADALDLLTQYLGKLG